MKKTQDFLLKNKPKINIVFIILVIVLTMKATGRGREDNIYLYVFLIVLAIQYGIDLITNLKLANKQRITRFISAIIGGFLFWQALILIF